VAKRSKSGLKHKRQSVKRRVQNQSVTSRLRTLTKSARTDPQRLAEAITALDRAARKGIIHPNAAARRKSRLMRSLRGSPR
jgi:small subunit ribosomal protein S20